MGKGGCEVFARSETVSCPSDCQEVKHKLLILIYRLRRAFLLIDAEHGFKKSDEQILEILRESGTPHQIVLSKVDKIIYPRAKRPSPEKLHDNLVQLRDVCEEVRHRAQPNGTRGSIVSSDIICCSSEKGVEKGRKLGLDELRWAALQAAGLECQDSGKKRDVNTGLLERTEGEDGIYAWGDT
jgi:GTP-binding protein